jgi:hypothetical protein
VDGVFVDFSRIFLLGILIFKWLTARRLYKSFGVKGLIIIVPLIYPFLHSLICDLFKDKLGMRCVVRIIGMLVDGKLNVLYNQALMGYFEVLYWH